MPAASSRMRQKLHVSGPIGAIGVHVVPPSGEVIATEIESTLESRDDVTGRRVIALIAS